MIEYFSYIVGSNILSEYSALILDSYIDFFPIVFYSDLGLGF